MSPMAQTSAPAKLAHLAASDDILKECDAINDELEELKGDYEQYFLGIERLPPAKTHQKLKGRMESIKSTFNRTTAVQFRVQSLNSKFLSYERLWNRTMQEMENGTYQRDLFKARMRTKQRRPEKAAGATAEACAPAPVPATEPAPLPAPSSRSPLAPQRVTAEVPEAKMRVIYQAYLDAKKRCGEDVSKMTFESVALKLRKQVPSLLEKHKAISVEFKVVIKEGKAVLRAVPKGAASDGNES
jgi:CHAT domain-containing protein